jgi:predicted DNA-binding transcriptional regulator YafY
MARGDQLARQWKIVQTLITARVGKSAADLARELDCHARTVYRDLEALQFAGFPMYTERVGGKSLWSLLDTVKHHYPIPFTLTELMALYFSRDLLKPLDGTLFYDALASLFQKVTTTLPPESKNYLKQVEKALKVGPRPYKQYERFKEVIHRVNEAIVDKRQVEMIYYTMRRRRMTQRRVAPYKIWFYDGTFYLIGHCSLKNDVRIFALDRIKSIHITEEAFAIPDGFNVERFMQNSFGVFLGEPVRVKVWFAPKIAGYIKEKIWHASQKIQEQQDGAVIFEAEVAGTEEIKFWLLSWGSKAVVLEPASLQEEIRAEAVRILSRYDTAAANRESLTA